MLYDLCMDAELGVRAAEFITCGFYRAATWFSQAKENRRWIICGFLS